MATGSSDEVINKFHQHLATKYEVTSNVDGVFLGILKSQRHDGSYIFNKPDQLQHIFDSYLPHGPTMPIPLSPAFKEEYIKFFDQKDSPLCDSTMFRSLLGAIMQFVDCRPDIAFQVAKISQRQCAPREKDISALLVLVHYLYGARDRSIILRRGDRESARTLVKLRGYMDMGWACHGNGKSHYCICFDLVDAAPGYSDLSPLSKIYNTGMFYFKSFMAPTVDLATCEGEVGALVEGGKDGIFFQDILRKLHQEQVEPTPFY